MGCNIQMLHLLPDLNDIVCLYKPQLVQTYKHYSNHNNKINKSN